MSRSSTNDPDGSPARSHTLAAIVSMGDELTLGQSLDTNSRWLAQRLVERGIVPMEHLTLPDDLAGITAALQRLADDHDLILCTGGLGPTADDLTRQALAQASGDVLIEDPVSLEQIRTWFAGRGRAMPSLNAVQALRPSRGSAIPNEQGTAPGIAAHISSAAGDGADCFCMPGPPREMMAMFDSRLAGLLRPPAGRTVLTRSLHTMGLGESEIAARLGDLMRRDASPLVGTTASWGMVSVRIRYEGTGPAQEAQRAIRVVEQRVRESVGRWVICEQEASLAAAAVDALRRASQTLTVVESCTAGLLGSLIGEIPGASDVFAGGWITYSNRLKHSQVGVPEELLAAHGAVSAQTAAAMARGGLERGGADHCLAITGIAGPSGGSEEKPVGTVYIAHGNRHPQGQHALIDVRRFQMAGDRESIRQWSARSALAILWYALAGRADTPLLRQTVRELH